VQALGYPTYSTDIVDRGYGDDTGDFLAFQGLPDPTIKSVVTNPPYLGTLPVDFISKALSLMEPVKGSVAMLLRNEFDSASKRTKLFRHPAFSMKLTLTSRPRWIEGSTGSPRHNYAWFIWDFDTVGTPPTITWDK
jgi:hypothetical protein